MDFASAAAQKTKATQDFGTSPNLTAPSEAAPGVFAKQLIGALKLTKVSDLGRPSPQAEAARDARAAHEARRARQDDARSRLDRPAKAERAERPEHPERTAETRPERKTIDGNDEPREAKAPERADKPAKAERADKPKARKDDDKPVDAEVSADAVDEAAKSAEVAADSKTNAAAEDAAAETAVSDGSSDKDQGAVDPLINPLLLALQAAEDVPAPIAVALLQSAATPVEGENAAATEGDGAMPGRTGAADPAAELQELLSGQTGRGTYGASTDAGASGKTGAAKGAAAAGAAHPVAAGQQEAGAKSPQAADAAEAFEKLLAVKVEGQSAAAKASTDASVFAAQGNSASPSQAQADAQPLATTQQVQTAQAQTGAKLDQPMAARSTAYLPATEQVAVQIQRAAEQGASRISIELDPAELGRVEVRLDVDRTGAVSASVVAERQETLDMLQKDQRSLEKALQNAGLSADSSNLSFSLREGNKGGREANDGQGNRGRGNRDGDDREVKPVAAEVIGRMRPINLDRALDIVA